MISLVVLDAHSKVIAIFPILDISHRLLTTTQNIKGMIFVYFTLASVLWWLVMAFNLFLLVVAGIPMRPLSWVLWFKKLKGGKAFLRLETLYIGYHLFCWLPPLVTLIISLSNEKLGYDQDLWYIIFLFFPPPDLKPQLDFLFQTQFFYKIGARSILKIKSYSSEMLKE